MLNPIEKFKRSILHLNRSPHHCDGNAVRYVIQRGYFLKEGRISDYYNTKYMTVLRVEQVDFSVIFFN